MDTYNRKDKNPIETIKTIKTILKSLGIKIREYPLKSISNSYYSIRIEIKGFYNMGSNGKGISKEFAMASAYAELMERLQSRMLIRNYFLNKVINKLDEKTTLNNIKKIENYYIGEKDENFYDFLANRPDFTSLEEFTNLHTDKKELLPSKLIGAVCHSNGLCAGNSYHEAISQGICEILERYAYKVILTKTPTLKNIAINDTLDCKKEIQAIKDLGLNISIKDCSLDNTYPVLGVLIQTEDKQKYVFALASDTNINIAIQRCITEICQGLNSKEDLLNKMKPYNNSFDKLNIEEKRINWLKCYSSNNGVHPSYIFESNENIDYRELTVFNEYKSNKEVYDSLLKILKNSKNKIYLKDYSKTDFHTYRVYIPSLSEIDKLDDIDLLLLTHYNSIESLYFNLNKDVNSYTLNVIQNVFEKLIKTEKYKFMNMGEYFHSNNYLDTRYNNISFELFYGIVCIKNNDFESIKNIENKKIKDYLESVVKLDNPIESLLKSLKLTPIICNDCKKCKLKRKCSYKTWNKINNKLILKDI